MVRLSTPQLAILRRLRMGHAFDRGVPAQCRGGNSKALRALARKGLIRKVRGSWVIAA